MSHKTAKMLYEWRHVVTLTWITYYQSRYLCTWNYFITITSLTIRKIYSKSYFIPNVSTSHVIALKLMLHLNNCYGHASSNLGRTSVTRQIFSNRCPLFYSSVWMRPNINLSTLSFNIYSYTKFHALYLLIQLCNEYIMV